MSVFDIPDTGCEVCGKPGHSAWQHELSDETKSYTVTWSIDLDATDPEDAARQALGMHRDPYSTATIFRVEGDGVSILIDVETEEARIIHE